MQFFLQVRDSWPPNYLSRLIESLVDLGNIFARAARAFWTPAAFATNDWRDLLNQFIRLDLRRQFFRNCCDQRHRSICGAHEENRSADLWFERVGHGLQQFAVSLLYFSHNGIFPDVRRGELLRDFSRVTLQLRLNRLRLFLFPLMNFSFEFFQLRRARVDSLKHLICPCFLGKVW